MARKSYKQFGEYESVAEQIATVKELTEIGHTNVTASEVLRTTSGVIAGFRRRHHIAPRPAGKAAPVHGPGFSEGFPEPPKEPLQFGEGGGLPRLAYTEAAQCVEPIEVSGKMYRCGYEREPHSLYCMLHMKLR